MRSRPLPLALVLLLICAPAAFPQEETSNDPLQAPTSRVFELVLPSEHLLGDWGGLRTKLEELGVTPTLSLITDLAWNPVGGRSEGVTAPTSIEAVLLFDIDKIFGVKGGTFMLQGLERFGDSLSDDIGNAFRVQQNFGFQTYRLVNAAYRQKLFDERLEFRIGRFATGDDFLFSYYNYGLMSQAFCATPAGIFLNAPGMTAYSGTWAALVKVKPTARSYVQGAVYNGDPTIRATGYHGVNFTMNGPLFAIAEVGYQINGLPGDNQLLGNYKLGGWYDDAELTNFESGARTRGSWGFYGLFDQVLVPFGSPGSNRGFGIFGSVIVAPNPEIQQLPLFITAGVSARGMFDSRPRDALSLGVASGYFSKELRRTQQNGQLPGPPGGQDYETVIELTYRFDLRKGALFIQPDLQYIIQPGGTGQVKNALVLGSQFGINF